LLVPAFIRRLAGALIGVFGGSWADTVPLNMAHEMSTTKPARIAPLRIDDIVFPFVRRAGIMPLPLAWAASSS
jgi:hypothetical protein